MPALKPKTPRRPDRTPPLAAIDLMLATDYHAFTQDGWIFEFKWDGYRVLGSKSQMLTRNKKDATAWYPEVLTALQDVRGELIVDGEICLLDDQGRPNFEGMRARTAQKRARQPVTYFVFDVLFAGGRDLRALPLIERKERLRKLMPTDHPRLVYVDYLETEGELLYRHAVANGMEGIVAKRANSPYVGIRSMDWRKAKPDGFHDGWSRPTRTAT